MKKIISNLDKFLSKTKVLLAASCLNRTQTGEMIFWRKKESSTPNFSYFLGGFRPDAGWLLVPDSGWGKVPDAGW